MILHLLKKDFRKLILVAAFFLAFVLLLSVTLFRGGFLEENRYLDASELILGGLLLHMLVFGNLMNVEKYEEKNSGYRIMAPLPISDVELVGEKFLSLFLSALFGIGSLFLIYRIFGVGEAWPGVCARYLLLTGALTLALNGLSYLGVFRFGYHKARTGIMAAYILAMLSPQLTIFLQQVREQDFFLVNIGQMSVPAVIGWIGAALVIFAVCFRASVKAKAGREL